MTLKCFIQRVCFFFFPSPFSIDVFLDSTKCLTLSFAEEKIKTTRVKNSQRFQTYISILETFSSCEKSWEKIQQRNVIRGCRALRRQGGRAGSCSLLPWDASGWCRELANSWQRAGKSCRLLNQQQKCTPGTGRQEKEETFCWTFPFHMKLVVQNYFILVFWKWKEY